jgi:hypothetical protein
MFITLTSYKLLLCDDRHAGLQDGPGCGAARPIPRMRSSATGEPHCAMHGLITLLNAKVSDHSDHREELITALNAKDSD